MSKLKGLRQLMHQFYPVSDEAWQDFAAALEEVEYKRKTILTRPGETEKYLYWVLEGIQRGYYVRNDKEYTVAFSFPPSFSGIPESFLTQRPSRYYLETLTRSHMYRLPYERLQKLMETHRELETCFRITTQEIMVGIAERIFELQAFSAEERFVTLLDRSPHVLNLIPHKYLASYLGMDPATFSTLLNNRKMD